MFILAEQSISPPGTYFQAGDQERPKFCLQLCESLASNLLPLLHVVRSSYSLFAFPTRTATPWIESISNCAVFPPLNRDPPLLMRWRSIMHDHTQRRRRV